MSNVDHFESARANTAAARRNSQLDSLGNIYAYTIILFLYFNRNFNLL